MGLSNVLRNVLGRFQLGSPMSYAVTKPESEFPNGSRPPNQKQTRSSARAQRSPRASLCGAGLSQRVASTTLGVLPPQRDIWRCRRCAVCFLLPRRPAAAPGAAQRGHAHAAGAAAPPAPRVCPVDLVRQPGWCPFRTAAQQVLQKGRCRWVEARAERRGTVPCAGAGCGAGAQGLLRRSRRAFDRPALSLPPVAVYGGRAGPRVAAAGVLKRGSRRLLIGALSVCSLCKRACAACGSTDARRAVW